MALVHRWTGMNMTSTVTTDQLKAKAETYRQVLQQRLTQMERTIISRMLAGVEARINFREVR